MKKFTTGFLLLTLFLVQFSFAQEKIDDEVLARIKTEGFQHSQIMDTVGYLVDVFGPRLTNSPNIHAAQEWTAQKMTSWGLKNAKTEPWGTFGSGWEVENYSFEMTAPTYDRINAIPFAWSAPTNGEVSGEPVFVSISSEKDFEKYRGKLKGKIVFNGKVSKEDPESRYKPVSKRFSEDQLKSIAKAIDPKQAGELGGGVDYIEEEAEWIASLARASAINKFFVDEGIAALVRPSRFSNGVLLTQGYYDYDPAKNAPAFVISKEQYARIMRLNDRKIPVKVSLSLKTKTYDDKTGRNVIAEIPGSDPKLKDQVVLLGGHFDSWHAGTGAADNAAGCAAVMEALRILQAIGVKPRRTIRLALWSGEEQDYYGSLNYVKNHYGDPATGKRKPEAENVTAYYNLDNGSGRIRGIYLQGNEAVRPIFESYLK
ncbi:MAG: M20/M25/M40 family metallo-hydrolase, partial [Acidobacteria bacterium]|nr:M20/M25/M40 family metallo-hydrolase [Acidobacteriota bacterium]